MCVLTSPTVDDHLDAEGSVLLALGLIVHALFLGISSYSQSRLHLCRQVEYSWQVWGIGGESTVSSMGRFAV